MNANKSNENVLLNENIRPIVTHEDVAKILEEDYGLFQDVIKDLNGYDDKNYLVKTKATFNNPNIENYCEHGYVFKIINCMDSKNVEFFNAQDCALIYLAGKNICCPKPVKNKNGDYLKLKKFESGLHIVRLFEFIPGKILAQIECSSQLSYECGVFVGTLNETLKTFQHVGFEKRDTIWMLINVPKISEFLFSVKEESKRKLVQEVLSAFDHQVVPKISKFEKGLIHGDFNEQNILTELRSDGNWHVKGVLDFGDSHISCFLFDLTIAMTYIIIHSRNIESGGYVLAGYRSVKPLTNEEMSLLKICVCARMCQSLVLGTFTLSRDPSNTYVARTGVFGWKILEELWKIPDDEVTKKWQQTCEIFVYDE